MHFLINKEFGYCTLVQVDVITAIGNIGTSHKAFQKHVYYDLEYKICHHSIWNAKIPPHDCKLIQLFT